jgi:hypothetical protein
MIRRISYIAALARLIAYEYDALGRRWKEYEIIQGSFFLLFWRIAHLFPTRSVVEG